MNVTEMTKNSDSSLIKWHSSHRSHTGNIRKYNEDACLVRNDLNLWSVADGMGGHEAGDVASNLIMQRLKEFSATDDLPQLVDRIDDTLINVNLELKQLGKEKYGNRTIGSTVVAMCAIDDNIAYLWAGDSRIYRIRGNAILQLTRDHSEVQNLIDQGLLRPEEAEFHPSSNVITRAIGASDNLFLSTGIEKTLHNDTYIICSDGLYRDIKESEMLKLAAPDRDVNEICDDLMNMALAREARDNITIIVTRSQMAND